MAIETPLWFLRELRVLCGYQEFKKPQGTRRTQGKTQGFTERTEMWAYEMFGQLHIFGRQWQYREQLELINIK